jgi:hypothetical protein
MYKILQFPRSKELFEIVVTDVVAGAVVVDGSIVVVVVVVVGRIEEVCHVEQHLIFILFVHHLLDNDMTTTNDG